MEPKCVLHFMRGDRTMIVRNFNGGMDSHCLRWDRQQVLVSGEPIEKMKGTEMNENPLCSWQLKSTGISSISPFHHYICFRAIAPAHAEVCVYCAWVCICFPLTCRWCAAPCSEDLSPRWLLSAGTSVPQLVSSLPAQPSSASPFPGHALPR